MSQQLVDKELNIYNSLDFKSIPHIPIKIVLFNYSQDDNILDIFNKYKPLNFDNILINKILEDENYTIYEINNTQNKSITCPHCGKNIKKSNKEYKTFLFFSKQYSIIILISNKSGSLFKLDLKFMNKYYPFISRFFFRSKELKEMISNIKNKVGYEIRFSNCVFKRYFEKIDVPETFVQYLNKSYEQAFIFAKENNLWVDSINLILEKINLRLSRKGIFNIKTEYNFNLTKFHEIYELILKYPILKFNELYNLILKNNSLSYGDTKVIKISLNEDLFVDNSSIEKFIEYISKKYSFSVISQDDNSIKLMCLDFDSGGSFDILIDSKNSIKIMPQFQMLSTTLNSIINFIINEYEGEISVSE
jgi:hypothetical protein